MNRRAKGNRNENRSAEMLQAEGYYCMTSRASATSFDVSATYMGNDNLHIFQRLIQVKTNSGYSKSVIEDLRVYAKLLTQANANARVELHNWKSRKRIPIITVITESPETDYIL